MTGRCLQAGYILRTFAHYVRDGLIPNMFPDRQKEGLYHTADATLWFFHALARYLKKAEDKTTLPLLLPILVDIAEHHLRGTKFNIHVDPRDGLLAQGTEGYQLTWMDAKMGNWVVTPRQGKAVEINALWFNALKLLEGWLLETGEPDAAQRFADHAGRARESFNQRFWFEEGGHLYDVVDVNGGDARDSACRPNQLFAISLDHPVLEQARWKSVVDVAERELVTPSACARFRRTTPITNRFTAATFVRAMALYHQAPSGPGSIGPFVDAWLKVHPGENASQKFLERFPESMNENGIGTISEVFDAREPHTAGGCIAQAGASPRCSVAG